MVSMRNNIGYCFLVTLVIFVFATTTVAQNLTLLLPYLNEKEQKAIDEAIDEIKKAGELVQEANQYYNEALGLQSNYDLDEETLQKKLKTSESKAINAQLKADKIYRATNKKIIDICNKIIETKASSNNEALKFKSDGDQMVQQAEEKRKSSESASNVYEKATLLNDASGLEGAAIESYISAITVSNNDELPKELSTDDQLVESEIQTEIIISLKDTTPAQQNVGSTSNVAINQGVINKYNNYISDPTIPEPLVVNRAGVTGTEDNIDGLANYFLNYNRGINTLFAENIPPTDTAGSGSQTVILLTDTTGAFYSPDTNLTAATNVMEPNKDVDARVRKKDKGKQPSVKERPGTTEVYNTRMQKKPDEVNVSEGQEDKIRFVVQIAASRIPLTRSQLWAIYPGNLSVEVVHDIAWYRYQITGFRIFSEANRVAIESGIKEAYVIAYIENNEINLVKARELTRKFEQEFIKDPQKSVAFKPDYFVQIKASRIALSEEAKNNLCSELGNCRVVIEEGWFKYQYFGGTRYEEALDIVKKLSQKSFVVAYRGGTKINLYKAKRKR